MSKSTYLLILLLIAVSFWTIIPLGFIINKDTRLWFYLIWLLIGILKFKNSRIKTEWLSKSKPVWWIYIGIGISFFMALTYYNQSLIRSIITSRHILAFLALPGLFLINPSIKDIKKSVIIFSYIYIFVDIIDSYSPIYFTVSHLTWNPILNRGYDYIREGDYLHFLEGFPLLIVASVFIMNDLRYKRKGAWIQVVIFGIFIFLIQNRTSILAWSGVFFYTLLLDKRIKKSIKIGIIFLITILVLYTLENWLALFQETQDQFNNERANRNIAYLYFLTLACPSILCYIFGNGLISNLTNYHYERLAEMGIYNSDVGFVGFWNQFGLIPICVFIYYLITPFIKKMSYIVKMNALVILICSPTVAYFYLPPNISWICIYFYMYYKLKNQTLQLK